ncbi:neuroglobin-like [Anticarsia gemmatalis]|uniref:neuroglobin-like n=1 Tax=Anticarsia gemmatalis TaxID=129554 RepID=UPI003F76B631
MHRLRVLSKMFLVIFLIGNFGLYVVNCDDKVTNVLSKTEVKNVQSTWANINKNSAENGFLIFTRMFAKDPETKAFFKRTVAPDATEEEMAKNTKFRKHINKIMNTLDASINDVQDTDAFVSAMEWVGEFHNGLGIKRRHFLVLEEVILEILEVDLKHNKEILDSWKSLFNYMFHHIFMHISD